MTKKELAKAFFNCFRTNIVKFDNVSGIGGWDIVFRNHAEYEKRQFTRDFNNFAKLVAKDLGVDVKEIKKTGRYGAKSYYYIWDPTQILEAYGISFKLNRRRMNTPHSIQDGCSHRYYVWINDNELVDEIRALNEERIEKERREKEESFPLEVALAKQQCREMIEDLKKWADGKMEFDDEAISRIDTAHFEICVMLEPKW